MSCSVSAVIPLLLVLLLLLGVHYNKHSTACVLLSMVADSFVLQLKHMYQLLGRNAHVHESDKHTHVNYLDGVKMVQVDLGALLVMCNGLQTCMHCRETQQSGDRTMNML